MLPRDAEPELVREELQPLLSILYKAFEEAIQRALKFFTTAEIDTSTFACLVRYGVKKALDREGFVTINEEELKEEASEKSQETPPDVQNLPNNGLLLSFKGCQIRVRKGHGRKPPAPTSGTQEDFYEQRLGLEDYWQLRLDFGDDGYLGAENGGPRTICMNLLILWDMNSKFQFRGLRLMRPRCGQSGPSAEWSVRIPHPAELIQGASVGHCFMFDPELPLAAVSISVGAGEK